MNAEKLKSWLWTGFIAIILLFFVLSGVKSCKNKREEKKEKAKIEAENRKAEIASTQKPLHWVIEKKITVCFTCEYDKIVRDVQPDTHVSFENATEDYSVKNKIDREYFASKGEDAMRQMGNTINNNELRFKSQNGKTGSIDIIFWVEVR